MRANIWSFHSIYFVSLGNSLAMRNIRNQKGLCQFYFNFRYIHDRTCFRWTRDRSSKLIEHASMLWAKFSWIFCHSDRIRNAQALKKGRKSLGKGRDGSWFFILQHSRSNRRLTSLDGSKVRRPSPDWLSGEIDPIYIMFSTFQRLHISNQMQPTTDNRLSHKGVKYHCWLV